MAGIVLSQASGNQVCGNNNNNTYYAQLPQIQKRGIVTTDSTLLISVNLLLNKEADGYLITVGTNQEAETVLECNKLINARINNLIGQLEPFGVEEKGIYVDFISQTKVFDYEVGEKQATEFQNGYEIKKNINIKINEIEYIDQLIELASVQEIYDEMNAVETIGRSRILGDNFYAVSPKTQYKKYQAFEASQLDVYRGYNNSESCARTEKRKNTNFYYEGVPTGGFEKIINPNQPKIGLQYVFSLNMI